MPKKQTKPKYPKELFILCEDANTADERFLAFKETECLASYVKDNCLDDTVAIYQFVRLAKVKRTVTVE